MEWTTIILAALSALIPSGLIGLFTIREQRKAAKLENDGKQIENKEKEDNRWEKLADQLSDQVEQLNTQIMSLNERLDKKDERIIELEDRCASLRQRLDEANTDLAKASLLKCNRLNCTTRRPPLGYTELSPEEIVAERNAGNIE